jgi:hypothetical protein
MEEAEKDQCKKPIEKGFPNPMIPVVSRSNSDFGQLFGVHQTADGDIAHVHIFTQQESVCELLLRSGDGGTNFRIFQDHSFSRIVSSFHLFSPPRTFTVSSVHHG